MPISTLIVSPDPGLARQVSSILEARGWAVTHTPSAAGVLHHFEALANVESGPFPLVIAEVDLPGGSGFELCRNLKAVEPTAAVLLLYSAGEGSVERNARDCGANAVLRRPFLASQLLECLDAMGRGAISEASAGNSLVESSSGGIVLSDSVPALATGDYQTLRNSESDATNSSTQELPALAIEAFDEDNPVSIPVHADATAHAMPALGEMLGKDPLDDSFDDLHPATARPDSLVLDTGEMGIPPSVREAARIRRAVDAAMEDMFRPGGDVERMIQEAVAKAVTAALAKR